MNAIEFIVDAGAVIALVSRGYGIGRWRIPSRREILSEHGRAKRGRSLVDWGGTSAKRMNEFVTVDAFFVLKASGRLKLSHSRRLTPRSSRHASLRSHATERDR